MSLLFDVVFSFEKNAAPWNCSPSSLGTPHVPSREVGLLALGVCKGVIMDAMGVNAAGADFIGPTSGFHGFHREDCHPGEAGEEGELCRFCRFDLQKKYSRKGSMPVVQ